MMLTSDWNKMCTITCEKEVCCKAYVCVHHECRCACVMRYYIWCWRQTVPWSDCTGAFLNSMNSYDVDVRLKHKCWRQIAPWSDRARASLNSTEVWSQQHGATASIVRTKSAWLAVDIKFYNSVQMWRWQIGITKQATKWTKVRSTNSADGRITQIINHNTSQIHYNNVQMLVAGKGSWVVYEGPLDELTLNNGRITQITHCSTHIAKHITIKLNGGPWKRNVRWGQSQPSHSTNIHHKSHIATNTTIKLNGGPMVQKQYAESNGAAAVTSQTHIANHKSITTTCSKSQHAMKRALWDFDDEELELHQSWIALTTSQITSWYNSMQQITKSHRKSFSKTWSACSFSRWRCKLIIMLPASSEIAN